MSGRVEEKGIRWTASSDDPLLADPTTAPIVECIGLVMGELGDEPRAAAGIAALRTLAAHAQALEAKLDNLCRVGCGDCETCDRINARATEEYRRALSQQPEATP